jgi:hypothetical protein
MPINAPKRVPGRQIDLVMRYFKLDEEPSLVDEYGTDPGFDRVAATRQLKSSQ